MSNRVDNSELLSEFEEAAEIQKGRSAQKASRRILFVSVVVEKAESKVLDFFGITETHTPRLFLIETKDDGNLKYLYRDTSITDTDITGFIDDFEAGLLAPWYKSDPPPKKQSGHTTVIVGETFASEVM
jgi:hypothetical protein